MTRCLMMVVMLLVVVVVLLRFTAAVVMMLLNNIKPVRTIPFLPFPTPTFCLYHRIIDDRIEKYDSYIVVFLK